MAKATVRIFKNHGFKQINRNIEELKFTLLNYNTVSFLRKIRQEKTAAAANMKRISFLAIFFVIASLRCHPRPTTHGFRLLRPRPPLRHDPVALLRRHGLHPKDGCAGAASVTAPSRERAGAVIGRMAMPLAEVYGVENEEVVKAGRASDLPYSYVHANTLDGMDFALLYYADRFFTERIETGYGYLCVEGMLDGKPTAVLLTRGDCQSRRPPSPWSGRLPWGPARR